MALINIANILRESLRVLKKSPESAGAGLFSYKRNRKVLLLRLESERFLLREDGYVTQEKIVDFASLEKELRDIIKREFPRSRKVRLYRFNHVDELLTKYQKI